MSSRGFHVRLISLGGERLDDVETIIYHRYGRLSYLRYCRRAVRDARTFRPDLIHVHYAAGFGLWGLAANFKPTLVSVWGTDVVDLPSNPVFRMVIRTLLKRASWITATSDYLRRVTVRLQPGATEKISVIPFGVSVPETPAPHPETKPVRICFLKAHRPVSGPDFLIKAMREVVRVMPKIQLSMAGDGEMTPKLRRMVQKYGLSENVRFIGRLDNNQISSFLQQHHFMVMPSRQESFGVAALEAAAYGRPTVASNVGGIPEVIRNGETGVLVPSENVGSLSKAIIKLAQDSDLRNRMGMAGYEFVKQNYPWEKSLDMMAALYERLIDENRENTTV